MPFQVYTTLSSIQNNLFWLTNFFFKKRKENEYNNKKISKATLEALKLAKQKVSCEICSSL